MILSQPLNTREHSLFTPAGLLCCALFSMALALPQQGHAAIYASFGDIEGGSMDNGYEGWNDLLFASLNITYDNNPGSTGGGRTRGEATLSDFMWEQEMDQSYPPLFAAILEGRVLDEVEVKFVADGGHEARLEPYFEIIFSNAVLTQLDMSANSNDAPMLFGSLAFEEIEMTYFIQDRNGRVIEEISASYNIETRVGDLADLGSVLASGLSGPGITAVPVPAPLLLLASGLITLIIKGRRTRA